MSTIKSMARKPREKSPPYRALAFFFLLGGTVAAWGFCRQAVFVFFGV